jgi:hypothetical protein
MEQGRGPEGIISIRFFIQIGEMERCIDLSVLWGVVPGVEKHVYTSRVSQIEICNQHLCHFHASESETRSFPFQGGGGLQGRGTNSYINWIKSSNQHA